MNVRTVFKRLGPGFVTGTSDDDPAGIGTYVQSGAQFGYGQLWTALFTFPIMAVVQEMCGRIGLVTGRGLAPLIRRHYAAPVLFFIVAIQVATNTVNIGADLSAMAQSAQLLIPISYWWLLAVTSVAMVAMITFLPYARYTAVLKFLGLSLLAYVAASFAVHVNWMDALKSTVIPHVQWDSAFLLTLIAVLGVTISPYEFFWQANQEVEELVEERKVPAPETVRPRITDADVTYMRNDTWFGMFFSNLITFFVIVTAGATLHVMGHTQVQSAQEAAEVLRPLAGPLSSVLFALGIVSSGLLAIPVMAASSAYAICGALKWRRSLTEPFHRAKRFYGIIALSCFAGLLVNAFHISPFRLLYYSGVLNGIISPFLLFIVTNIAGNPEIMGKYVNSWWNNAVGYSMAAAMAVAIAAFFVLGGSQS